MLSDNIGNYRIKGLGARDVVWYRVQWAEGPAANYGQRPDGVWIGDDFRPVTAETQAELSTIPAPRPDRRVTSPDYRAEVHALAMAFARLTGGCWHHAAEQAEEHARCVPSPLNRDVAGLARRRSNTILSGRHHV